MNDFYSDFGVSPEFPLLNVCAETMSLGFNICGGNQNTLPYQLTLTYFLKYCTMSKLF